MFLYVKYSQFYYKKYLNIFIFKNNLKTCYNLYGGIVKKINNFLEEKIEKIYIIFLFLQPVIDSLTAIMLNVFDNSFTIGIVVRFLFLLLIIYYFLFVNKVKNKKTSTIYLLLIFIYMIIFIIDIGYFKGISALGYEAKSLFKSFYFPIILVCTYFLFRKKDNIITPKLLRSLFIFYALLIFIPNLLGFGFDAYSVTKGGSIGLFYTANEIGAIISILMPIFIYFILDKKNKILTLIATVILLYILTSMGTKGPLLSFIIILIYYLIKYIIKCIKLKNYKSIGIINTFLIAIICLSFIFIPKTSFYKNICIHLEFLEVEKISDIADPKIIDHFIFSQRLTFLSNTNKIYKDSSITEKLFGIGYIDNYSKDNVSMKMIEMDFFDLFYRHGIIGFAIYMSSFIYILYKIFTKYLKTIKESHNNKIINSYLLSLVLSIILSSLTGHVILSPSVSIYVALIINLFYNELYKGVKEYD